MSLLSERQKEELYVEWPLSERQSVLKDCSHKAILEYLHSNNFTDAFTSLKSDTGIDYTPDPKAKYAGLLEKKWTSVIRLQKKVCGHRLLVQNHICEINPYPRSWT